MIIFLHLHINKAPADVRTMPEICANGIAAAGRIFIQDGPACLAVLEKRWHIAIRKQDKPIFSSPPAGSLQIQHDRSPIWPPFLLLYPKRDDRVFLCGFLGWKQSASLLEQVWINLIDNAIKHSPADSSIHIAIIEILIRF